MLKIQDNNLKKKTSNDDVMTYACTISCVLSYQQRVKPIGYDACNNTYWYFDGKSCYL